MAPATPRRTHPPSPVSRGVCAHARSLTARAVALGRSGNLASLCVLCVLDCVLALFRHRAATAALTRLLPPVIPLGRFAVTAAATTSTLTAHDLLLIAFSTWFARPHTRRYWREDRGHTGDARRSLRAARERDQITRRAQALRDSCERGAKQAAQRRPDFPAPRSSARRKESRVETIPRH